MTTTATNIFAAFFLVRSCPSKLTFVLGKVLRERLFPADVPKHKVGIKQSLRVLLYENIGEDGCKVYVFVVLL